MHQRPGLAGGAVWYAVRVARRQFKLMDEQGKIIDKQVILMEDHKAIFLRLEEGEKRQEGFLEVQAGILKTQHDFFEKQQARKVDLVVGYNRSRLSSGPKFDEMKFQLYARNDGDRDCAGFAYTFLCPNGTAYSIRIIDGAEPSPEASGERTLHGRKVPQYIGKYGGTVFGTRSVPFANIAVKQSVNHPPEEVTIWYSVTHESGRQPRKLETFSKLKLRMNGEPEPASEESQP